MSGESGGRIRLAKLNEQLTCKLCGGYFIDATTIIECLHSFCKSCIVKYLETNKYCPICEVQVHKSKPLLNIRPDHTLQDIVYKLVPGCYQNEMRCRREFYDKHPEAKITSMSPEARGEPIESHIYSPDESLSLSLEYYNPNHVNEPAVITSVEDTKEPVVPPAVNPSKVLQRRYLRCPAAVTVFHLQKLIRAKYGLSDVHRVDVMYKEESLCSNYTLMDVMYIYHWRRKVPLHLSYRIFESSPKRLKLSDDNTHFKESLSNAGICQPMEMKEVQLKISETGVMSFTGVSGSPESKKAVKNEPPAKNDNQNAAINVKAEEKQSTSDEKETTSVKKNSVDENKKANSNNNESEKKASASKTFPERKLTANNTNNTNNTNSNANNSNNNNTNNSNNTQESTSKPETREKTKNSENNQLPSGSGSKIDALSAKLQFQPKVGQINNTYSKKTPKEKKTILEKVLKKSDNKNSTAGDNQKESMKNSADKNTRSVNSLNIYTNKSNSTSKVATSVAQSTKNNESSSFSSTSILTSSSSSSSSSTLTSTSSSTMNVSGSASVTTRRHSSPDRNKELNSSKKGASEVNNEGGNQKTVAVTSTTTTTTTTPSSKGPSTRQNSNNSSSSNNNNNNSNNNNSSSSSSNNNSNHSNNNSSSNLANESLNVGSTNVPSILNASVNQSESSFGVQDLVNSSTKNSAKNLSLTQKQTLSSANVTTTQSSTMSSSAYSISSITKNVYSGNTSGNNNNTNNNNNSNTNNSSQSGNSLPSSSSSSASSSSVTLTTTSTSLPTSRQETLKSTSEMTVYAVPPCPDAIPISLMKPTVRKTEMISKGTNLNDICAKIGTSGSKINDICAKIGEHSKEKNKAENKSRPEIPDLLKITKKSSSDVMKHISNIPNVPIYTPSSLLGAKNSDLNSATSTTSIMSSNSPIVVSSSILTTSVLSSLPSSMSVTTTTLTTPTTSSILSSHAGIIGKGNSVKKSQSSSVGYKTLRDPPKSWNPTLSKNNYVATKNQAKEIQITALNSSDMTGSGISGGKSIMSKPAKIFKMRNMPRYLGNPASGVKPMYNVNSGESKDGKDQQSSVGASSKNSAQSSGMSSMTKIDPKTLAPIVSTNSSSIISLPPYSPNRNYQNTPFSRSTANSPMSPRNSPVNMLSTNPFIPSPTPNTNPRLIYSHFPPPAFATDASRFPSPLIRSPIGIPPPSAFHSSLPPSITKLYQRTSYIPQTTTAPYSQGLNTQPVSSAMQRIPSSNYSSPSKSPKTTVTNSTFNVKGDSTASTSLESIVHLAKTISHDSNVFNLSTTTGMIGNYVSDLSKNSNSHTTVGEITINPVMPSKAFSSSDKNVGKNLTCDDKKGDDDAKSGKDKGKNSKDKERIDDNKKIDDKEKDEKGGKNDDNENDKEKMTEDDKNKEKNKDKFVKKKGKELEKKVTKRTLKKDSNDSNDKSNYDERTSESNDSAASEKVNEGLVKVNGDPNKSHDQTCDNSGNSSKFAKNLVSDSMNQQSNSNFSSSNDEKNKNLKSSHDELSKKSDESKSETQNKSGDSAK